MEEMEDCSFRINANLGKLTGEEAHKLDTQVQCKPSSKGHLDLTNELNRNKSLVA